MQQPTVLLLFGGESSEHEVSLLSAKNVYDAIDKTKYEVVLGYINQAGEWFHTNSLSGIKQGVESQLTVSFATGQFSTNAGQKFRPDVILPILHGKNGEDGALQGLAQLLHIPIVGCDMTASVLAMDKIASKALFAQVGLDVLPYQVHHAHDEVPVYEHIADRLGPILFVKPSRAGSSVGVSRVTNRTEYIQAIKLALQHDSLILIEQAARSPREIEIAVLGNEGSRLASVAGEIQPDREFYSYESKYDENSHTSTLIPANLDQSDLTTVRTQALIAYDALHSRGMARVDFLLDKSGTFYINEINTIPGFTNISMYPKLWEYEGISYSELIDRLIIAATE